MTLCDTWPLEEVLYTVVALLVELLVVAFATVLYVQRLHGYTK